MGKNKKNSPSAMISAAVFCTVLGGISLWLTLAERPAVSETEKRELETRPELTADSYFSGEFAGQLDKYYTDTVPLRDDLVNAASLIEKARGISVSPKFYGNVAEIVTEETNDDDTVFLPDVTETVTEAVTEEVPAETEPVITEAPAVTETVTESVTEAVTETAPPEEEEFTGNINDFLNNGILVNGIEMYGEEAGIMLFGGNKKEGLRYANVINGYKEALGDDINVYSMVVPTSAEFYLPKKYSKYSASQKDAIDYIYENLDDSIITIDAYSELAQHTDEYIYFRTDHHWTGRGAYYAYTAFCKTAGIDFPDLGEYEERSKEGFVGSLYSYTNDPVLKAHPETFYYYIPPAQFSAQAYRYNDLASLGPTSVFHEYASGGNMYGMFLGGDNMHVKITSDSGTGRKLVIFKESYGNAIAPYFVNGFDEIYVIDIRYFGVNAVDYIKSIGATDVLFVDNIFAANTGTLITSLESKRLVNSEG
ncbi:MAG: DHHW family protein [Oscillospiraceae bacterium]|nr:DHHW family protein [Oscillospiraceae bacterium]